MSLSISKATKKFGDFTAVDDISLDVSEGQMHGFLGANGAGKTTTFRMALGLLAPTAGEVLWKGRSISYADSPYIGYLPEERGLYPKMKVQEQLVYLARLRRMDKKQAELGAQEWLERFEVPHYANKKVEELSKGNQQKIQLIASLLHKPELLILDEPFSGLDPVNVEMLKRAILDFQQQGATIVFSSHRMDHVEELCDNMSILDKGKLIVHGSIRDVKRSFGKQNVRLYSDADITLLAGLPGIEKFTPQRSGAVFRIADESVGQLLLTEALKLGPVRQFALEEPTLEEIFIEKVGRTDA
ncbi:ABC transporter ATP-binding protein [Planococcus dechangensis]|uniref:ABC transporter ATP-binding protein n=1 Tax=Planococcus dechangensis TaxID=1176255 RepID=A0ABV9MDW7_9BACL